MVSYTTLRNNYDDFSKYTNSVASQRNQSIKYYKVVLSSNYKNLPSDIKATLGIPPSSHITNGSYSSYGGYYAAEISFYVLKELNAIYHQGWYDDYVSHSEGVFSGGNLTHWSDGSANHGAKEERRLLITFCPDSTDTLRQVSDNITNIIGKLNAEGAGIKIIKISSTLVVPKQKRKKPVKKVIPPITDKMNTIIDKGDIVAYTKSVYDRSEIYLGVVKEWSKASVLLVDNTRVLASKTIVVKSFSSKITAVDNLFGESEKLVGLNYFN